MTFSLSALFAAGLLTFLSPCVLPLVPIYLAMLAGTSAGALREGKGSRSLLPATVAFSLGLASVFVALGMAASAIGQVLSGHRTLVMQLAGLAIFLAGLKLLGFLHVPWMEREARPWLSRIRRGGGLLWPFLFGAAFALGWSPCVGPVLGSVLAFAAGAGSSGKGALYLAIYALGLTLPLVAVSLVAPLALRLIDRAKRFIRTFELLSGGLLAVMGLLLITGQDSLLSSPTAAPAPASISAAQPAPVTCGAGTVAPSPSEAAPAPNLDRATGEPTLVEFVSTQCPICERMRPVVASAKQVCASNGINILEIEVGTPEGRAQANRRGVLGVPTFLFLDRDGQEVARLVGEQPKDTLVQSLEILAGQKCDGFRPFSTGMPGT